MNTPGIADRIADRIADTNGRLPLPWLSEPLARALRQPAHALLVVGGAGVGSLALQLTLAQAWLCEHTGAAPCGHCASCHLVRAQTHPDLLVLLPETLRMTLGEAAAPSGDEGAGKRKPSRQIRIDEVRAATDWIATTSSRGRAKVLVIHPASAMNLHAASALLKTLEEPPAGARLLLACADPDHLMATVRSRCQRIDLPPPAPAVALDWLRAQQVEDAEVLLAATSGRPLDALAMAREGISAATWSALPRAVAAGHAEALAGWPLAEAVDALQKLCHDAMAVAAGGSARYFPPASVPRGAELACLIDWSRDLAQIARVEDHPTNDALQVAALVLKAHAAWASAAARKGSDVATLRA